MPNTNRPQLLFRAEKMTTISKIGKYLIRRELGQGAMGIVYEGFDPVIERTVAIKTILPSKLTAADSTETLARFKREAQSAGHLNHPGIVAIYEYGEVVPERAGAPIDPDATLVDAFRCLPGRDRPHWLCQRPKHCIHCDGICQRP